MNGIKLFKKFLLPCGICAAVPVVKAKDTKAINNDEPKLVRPSELPIYKVEKTETKEPPCERSTEPNVLEQGFGSVRKVVQDLLKQVSGYTSFITDTFDTGLAHSQGSLDYLREETNTLPRIGAVGVGGLSGLILGLRGGKFKKLVYSSTGALVVAAICYPKEAEEGIELAKHYINIGYNFVYGVKPGDGDQLQISWPELPKIPTNISELGDLAGSAASSAITAAGTLVNKASEAFHEFSESKPPHENEKPKKS